MAERLGPAAILALVVLGIIAINSLPGESSAPASTEEQAQEHHFQTAVIAARHIKQVLREPESVEWLAILVNEQADTVCLQFRARNGFGGISTESAVITEQATLSGPSAWRDHCAGLQDFTHARQAI